MKIDILNEVSVATRKLKYDKFDTQATRLQLSLWYLQLSWYVLTVQPLREMCHPPYFFFLSIYIVDKNK